MIRSPAVASTILVATALAGAAELPWPSADFPNVRVVAADVHADAAARDLAVDAPGIVGRVALRMGLAAPARLEVVVAERAPRTTEEAGALGLASVPYWAAGLAEPARGRILLFGDRLHVLGHDGLRGALAHEAAHLVLHGAVPGRALPRWFDEGVAMSVERALSWHEAFELARMTVLGDPPRLGTLDDAWPDTGAGARTAYATALSFLDYAQEGTAPGAPRRLVQALADGADFERAFTIAYGTAPRALEDDWRGSLRGRYVLAPLIFAGTLANIVLGLLALVAVTRAGRRRRARLAALPDDPADDVIEEDDGVTP